MSKFRLRILEAEEQFYDGDCESLIVPTQTGQYGILAGHSKMILALVPGMLKYLVPKEAEHRVAAVSNGIVKVDRYEVLILVDSAEHPDEIDIQRAKRAAQDAREALLEKGSKREYNAAQAHLARAMNRLRVKEERTDL